jgi:hypothetical protein
MTKGPHVHGGREVGKVSWNDDEHIFLVKKEVFSNRKENTVGPL